ncbi:MAG: DUF2336 domain-containing protein [Pseudomonadota bacterium]
MSTAKKLTGEDVAKLLQDPSTTHRAEAAEKIALSFSAGNLSDSERQIAEDIFRVMVRDVEHRVRRALADSLKESSNVPRDVAVSIASDVADIAVPFIEVTQALNDDDLVSIIEAKGSEHQKAIARRETVSARVADALVETKNEDVVAALVENEGADLSEKTMSRVLDEFGEVKRISNPMAQRPALPLHVAERLVSLVSDKLQEQLLAHQDLPPDVAMDLVMQSRERATVSLLDGSADTPDVQALVEQLHRNHRLTPTLVIRALCMGDLTFFEAALAKRAGIPVVNAYKLVHDRGDLALSRLFAKSDMPQKLLPLARVALDVAEEMLLHSRDDREKFRTVMLERVITHFEDEFDTENLDYFISKLAAKPRDARGQTIH